MPLVPVLKTPEAATRFVREPVALNLRDRRPVVEKMVFEEIVFEGMRLEGDEHDLSGEPSLLTFMQYGAAETCFGPFGWFIFNEWID